MRHPSKVGAFCARKMIRTGQPAPKIVGLYREFVGYGPRGLNINVLGRGGPPAPSKFRKPGKSGCRRGGKVAEQLSQADVVKTLQKAAAAFKTRLKRKADRLLRSAQIRKVGGARGQ